MASPQVSIGNQALSLPAVPSTTIVQFEHSLPDAQALYRDLFDNNPQLALWLRRRAQQLYPDLADREDAATLALEALAILGNQTTINHLQQLLAGTLHTEVSAKALPPTT
jgi:hypothetical protein